MKNVVGISSSSVIMSIHKIALPMNAVHSETHRQGSAARCRLLVSTVNLSIRLKEAQASSIDNRQFEKETTFNQNAPLINNYNYQSNFFMKLPQDGK